MKTLQRLVIVWLILLWLLGCSPARTMEGIHLDLIEMPPGFKISLYARVPGARSMALSSGGILFVGTRGQGKVYAVLDKDGDQTADDVITVAKDLRVPNGVAVRNGALYVAEISRVLRFDGIEADPANPGKPVVVIVPGGSIIFNLWRSVKDSSTRGVSRDS